QKLRPIPFRPRCFPFVSGLPGSAVLLPPEPAEHFHQEIDCGDATRNLPHCGSADHKTWISGTGFKCRRIRLGKGADMMRLLHCPESPKERGIVAKNSGHCRSHISVCGRITGGRVYKSFMECS